VWGNVTVGNESYQLGQDEYQPLLNSDGTEATEPTSTGLLLRHVKKVMILKLFPNIGSLSSHVRPVPAFAFALFSSPCFIFVDSFRERTPPNQTKSNQTKPNQGSDP
jgi:hypothetical protein